MSVQTFLNRLHGVKKTANGWRADCPNGHKHARQSLSITEVDGVPLFHCFACHGKEEILRRVGLDFRDLYPARPHTTSPASRQAAREAFKKNCWSAALRVMLFDAIFLLIACAKIGQDGHLSTDDYKELRKVYVRLTRTIEVLL